MVTGKCDSRQVNSPDETREYDGPISGASGYLLIFASGVRTGELIPGGTQAANSRLSEDELTTQVGTFAGRLSIYGRHHGRPVAGKVSVGRQHGRRGEQWKRYG